MKRTALKILMGMTFCALFAAQASAIEPRAGGDAKGALPDAPPPMMHDMGPGPMPGMPFFMGKGLRLSDEQLEKTFVINYQFELSVHEKQRDIRKASRALRELSHADKYDEGKAKELAGSLAQSIADLQLLLSKKDAQLYAILTPEQKADMAKEESHRDFPPRPMEQEFSKR